MLELGNLASALSPGFVHHMRNDIDALHLVPGDGPLAGWLITRSSDHRSLMLSRDGHYLTVRPGNESLELAAEVDESAMFLAASEADTSVLKDLAAGKWLVQSGGAAMHPESAVLVRHFGLRIGPLDIDLRWNLPFELSEWPHRLSVLKDGWRIDLIYQYRPLIYFAAFGADAVMQQFALSLRSLVTVGDYDGPIVVLTDKTAAEIAALVPPAMRATLVIIPTAGVDPLAFMAARLTIANWRDAWDFQPLLYVDADVLFDLPVAPMLYDIARSDKISAPVEPTAPLATSAFVGSGLLEGNDRVPASEMGVNSGTLGIPNLRRHARILDLVRRILQNRATMFGRDALPYADQSVLNYVLFQLDGVDKALLAPYVRLVDHTAVPSGRRGLVHFCWVPDAGVRVELMRIYLDELARMDAGPASYDDAPANPAARDISQPPGPAADGTVDLDAISQWLATIGFGA